MIDKSSKSILRLEKISKKYPRFSLFPIKINYTQALSETDLELKKGAVTCILGPNGAGKTTILKIIAGLIIPDSGKMVKPGSKCLNIGFVTPNERSFYWRLTGRENLRFFASLFHLHGIDNKNRVIEVLNETGLNDFADIPYRLYSTGIKQRLNIARALLSNPTIVLLDEPTTHLDPLAKVEFWEFIQNHLLKNLNSTILLATHDLEEANFLADTVIILNNGEIVARGSIKNLQYNIQQESLIRLSVRNQDVSPEWNIYPPDIVTQEIKEEIMYIETVDKEIIRKIISDLCHRGKIPVSLNREKLTLLSILKYYTRVSN